MISRRHSTALAAIALGASLTLTGCFGNPLDGLVGGGGIGNVLEDATGGLVGGSSNSLPNDFPSEVPVINGEIQGGIGIGAAESRVWTVNISAPGGTVEEVAAHVHSQFMDTGFEGTMIDTPFEGRTGASYTKGDLTALVTVADDESTLPTVTYLVSRSS